MTRPLEPGLVRRADDYLDADTQLKLFAELGEELLRVFGADKEDRVSTQVRNLQQIAISARRLSDVEVFVKNQMGKEKLDKQNRPGSWRQVGDALLAQIKSLRKQAEGMTTDEGQQLLLRLHLVRGWVRIVVGAYMYKKATQKQDPAMPELDVEIDGSLRGHAVREAEEFVQRNGPNGTPVSRSQIAGLVQIASNEPPLLSQFAGNQKERAQKKANGMKDSDLKKAKLVAEIDFWAKVQTLGEGKGDKCPWSLLKLREAAVPPPLRQEKLPPGTALSREEREKRDRQKRELEAWERQWNLDHYRAFFRQFCAHYLYRMPPEKQ